MDKLSKYNQKLLAVIGTLFLGALVAGLVAVLLFFVVSLFGNQNSSEEVGLQIRAHDAADSTAVRTQQITFQEPVQIDTAQAVYVIPVSQVNLAAAERRSLVTDLEEGFRYSSSSRFDSYEGLFNNFILFEANTGVKTKIFSKKVSLSAWSNAKVNGIEVLLFLGTETDSNKDNRLDTEDYQSLYAFYLKDRKLVEYHVSAQTVLGYKPLPKTNLISVQLGIDKNKDVAFDYSKEPRELAVLNVETRELTELVPPEMKTKIQTLVDK